MPGGNTEFEGKNAEEIYIDENLMQENSNAEDENLRITDESIAIVAGVAASEIESVARMNSGFAGGIVEALGRRNPAKGVKVVMHDGEAVIDLFVIVNYGKRISDIAWEIQEHVKESVERLTGVDVSSVNIHIQGIEFPNKGKNKNIEKNEPNQDDSAVKNVKTRDMSVFQYFDDGNEFTSDNDNDD